MRSLTLRILVRILVPMALLSSFALLAIWAPLPHPFPPALSGARNLVAAILTAILGLGYLIALSVSVIHSFLRAGHFLDPVVESLGFVCEPYLLLGRHCLGRRQGRELAVTFLPAQGLRPAQLDLHVSARLGLRAALGPRRPLLDCRDCPRLKIGSWEWDGPPIWTRDGDKVRRLLTAPAVMTALHDLTVGQGGGRCDIYLQPERVWLRIRQRRLTEEEVRGWLDQLLILAEGAECALPVDSARRIES
jgi:hypothetical protein